MFITNFVYVKYIRGSEELKTEQKTNYYSLFSSKSSKSTSV